MSPDFSDELQEASEMSYRESLHASLDGWRETVGMPTVVAAAVDLVFLGVGVLVLLHLSLDPLGWLLIAIGGAGMIGRAYRGIA